jgi:hypothetical protein
VLLEAAIVKPMLEVADGAREMVAETRANYYVHAIMNSEFLPVAGSRPGGHFVWGGGDFHVRPPSYL